MERTEDPYVYRANLSQLSDDLTYRFVITDKRGDVTRNDEPYRILVMADEAP